MPNPARSVLVAALKEAGALVRAHAGHVRWTYKSRANLVTAVDKKCEALILKRILKAFPDHGYLAEERPPNWKPTGPVWVIDPLDGTTNFAHGFPVACVSIGLVVEGRPVLGGVYDPFRDELFLAEKGQGTTLNGRRVKVSRQSTLAESLLLTGFPYDRAVKAKYYLGFYAEFMRRCHDVRRSGSAALDLSWTSCGRVDAYWEFNLKPWDVAAGRLLVEEAGGKVTDFAGNVATDLNDYGRQTLASNGRIHAEVLRILRRRLALWPSAKVPAGRSV